MRLFRLLLVLGQIGSIIAQTTGAETTGTRTTPIRRYPADIVPLAIAQDRQGLLWLGATAGVLRFDGLRFEPVHAPAGIDLSRATHIATSPDGSIWIACAQGLLRYRNGSFVTALAGEVKSLLVTHAGRILASVGAENVLHIAMDLDRDPVHWSTIPTEPVTGAFHEDLEGNVWFGCGSWICSGSDNDLQALAAGGGLHKVRRIPSAQGDRKPLNWADVVALPDGRIWGRNGPDILIVERGRTVSRTTLPVETFGGVRPRFFLDRRGRLWIPNRTLNFVEKGTIRILSGAPLEQVTVVFEDRWNTLWFGLAGKGLAALPDDRTLESWSEADGLSGSVLDFTAHPKLGLVAATDMGQYAFEESASRWRAVGAPGKSAFRSVAAGPDDTLLSLPHSAGLLLSAPPFRSARKMPLPPEVEPNRLRKLYRDSHGAVWIADIAGLLRLDGGIRRLTLPQGGTYASDLAMDSEGRLWVGYQGGVARCVGENCISAIGPTDGLVSPKIRTIAPGPGEIWVGYRDGGEFSRFEQRQGRWLATHFKSRNGFGPPDTHFLRRDSRGWIWRGSTDGVYVSDGQHVDPEDWIHLTFGDRVNASYANMYGFLEQPDGAIWIGTQTGAVRLRASEDWFRAAPPRMERIAAPGQEDLEIRLSQPGLPPFQSRLFRYRLLPVDTEWRFSVDGMLCYAKLPAGSYRLQVATGGGNPPAEYPLRVDGASGTGSGIWIFVSLSLGVGLALALVAWRRFSQRARITEDYWREKRHFLESRDSVEDWSGRRLDNRFLLQDRIATGGFAAVYRAIDELKNAEPVAVKLLHPVRDHVEWRRRRFVDEVAALQKLDDPGIVQIRAAGEATPDQPYLAMEFIDGVTLRALMADGPVEFDRAARLLQQIGKALAAAHRAKVLHRDLKPENVMVVDAGSAKERIKLIDFGIASIQVDQPGTHSTQLAGSPGYVAPERWVGMESYASDIYSMAVLASEMLRAGERPLPQSAADLLAGGMAYDPEKRPKDPEQFASDLSNCLVAESR